LTNNNTLDIALATRTSMKNIITTFAALVSLDIMPLVLRDASQCRDGRLCWRKRCSRRGRHV